MPIVKRVDYKEGTDKQFSIIARFRNSAEPKNLSELVGASGDSLSLQIEGESEDITLTLDDSPYGKLEVLSTGSGLAGRVRVTFLKGIPVRRRSAVNMELSINLPSEPEETNDNCISFPGGLNVISSLFV